MKNPVETSPGHELLPPQEAADYINATNIILSEQNIGISRFETTPRPTDDQGQRKPFEVGTITICDQEKEGISGTIFEATAKRTDGRDSVTIGQSVEGVRKDDKPYDVSVRREIDRGYPKPEYFVTRWHDGKETTARASTPEERTYAEVLFATMTTDYKAIVERRLPIHRDAIEALTRNPPEPFMTKGIGGTILRMITKQYGKYSDK